MSGPAGSYAVPHPRTGVLDLDAAQALAGLIGATSPESTLPPLWHWVHLLDRPRQEDLGADGHPRSSQPGGEQTSRMFAGGRLITFAPVHIGQSAHRSSALQRVQTKTGRSGDLIFVTVRHELRQNDTLCVVDEQDLVYRKPAGSVRPAAAPSDQHSWSTDEVALVCDPVLLFRFSALTYNAHRIHYDLDYARSEGYPGLVIHGPLQVLLMAEALRRSGHDFAGSRFEYRLVSPAFAPQLLTAGVHLEGGAARTSVRTSDGTTTATGRLEPFDA